MDKNDKYWDWVAAECAAYGSDGCTGVTELYHSACSEHDLAYHYHKDPRDAYRHFCDGVPAHWDRAKPISRGEADKRFRQRMQSLSKVRWFSPVSWYRWVGVRIGGHWAWN